MRVSEAVNTRHSMRVFKPDPVSKADVEWIISTASRAASNGNLQPWKLYITMGQARQRLSAAILKAMDDGDSGPGGCEERMRRSRCSFVGSSKGSLCAIIWYKRTPTDQRSERESIFCVSRRSGEQYALLANTFIVYLRVCVNALAIPKSSTLT